MKVTYLGHTKDQRTKTNIVYAQMSVDDYLNLVGDKFDEFSIQRRREKHRAYARMKTDIIAGAQLPPITLAIKPEFVADLIPLVINSDFQKLEAALAHTNRVNILDGLQRTYIMHDLKKEGVTFKDGQKLLIEYWLEANIKTLIYRIIVLNAGQKPMSMRHQVELLFETIRANLQSSIPNLQILAEREDARRTGPRQYAFDKLVMGYQSFLTGTPEVVRDNLVAQALVEEDVLEKSEEELGTHFDHFVNYLRAYAELDDHVCRVYQANSNTTLPSGLSWWGNENVINAFFAALSAFGTTPDRLSRIDCALRELGAHLERSTTQDDPLGLEAWQKVTSAINPRKSNVGYEIRQLMVNGFREFFREEGQVKLSEMWAREAR